VCPFEEQDDRVDRLDRLGIEFISAFGLPPVQFVSLAADLGCRHIGMLLTPMADNPLGYPAWSLRQDASLRREMLAAMRDRGVSISLGEGFFARSGADLRNSAADLELMRELGVRRIGTLSIDSDSTRAFDQFATLAEMTDALGMELVIEFGPRLAVADLPTAAAAVRHVGRPNTKLLIDTMHLVRSGSAAADLAALDAGMIGYVQLCDAPLVSNYADYVEEAKYERMNPGAGELPLLDILRVLPPNLVIGLEVPQRGLARSGVSPHERLSGCVAAARSLLARAGQIC
jgi:sugar phosphate isomerase/epimerase